MFYQAIVRTPSNLSVLAVDGNGDYILGNSVVGELAAMRAEWPESSCPDGGTMMPETRVVGGEKLNHIILSMDYADPLQFAKQFLVSEGLTWTIEALAPLYTHDDWEAELDADGDPTGEFVASTWDKYPSAALIDFIPDVVVGGTDEVPVFGRPTAPIPLHAFDGCVRLTIPVA